MAFSMCPLMRAPACTVSTESHRVSSTAATCLHMSPVRANAGQSQSHMMNAASQKLTSTLYSIVPCTEASQYVDPPGICNSR